MLWLILLAIAGVGLGSTALYQYRLLWDVLVFRFWRVELVDPARDERHFKKHFRRSSLVNSASRVPLAYSVLLKVNIIPKPIDINAHLVPEFIPWRHALDYVIGWLPEHLRDVVLMVAVPLLIIRGKNWTISVLLYLWRLAALPESVLAHSMDEKYHGT